MNATATRLAPRFGSQWNPAVGGPGRYQLWVLQERSSIKPDFLSFKDDDNQKHAPVFLSHLLRQKERLQVVLVLIHRANSP